MKREVSCVACGISFLVSKSRNTAKFCSSVCYQQNQNLRVGSATRNTAKTLIGKTIGLLLVTGKSHKGKLLCECDCGNTRHYPVNTLSSGRVKSCGCFNRLKSRKDGQVTAWNKWFSYLKTQAKGRELAFALSFEEIKKLCQGDCTYCGSPPKKWEGSKNLYLANCKNKKTKTADMAFAESKVIYINGIDRIDSDNGYVISNVQSCCENCNLSKLDRSDLDFRAWIVQCYNHTTKDKK